MRFFTLAAAAIALAMATGPAVAADYCRAYSQAECTADKACTWRAAHAAGDINPKSGKAFKRAGKEGCRFSPKDAQAILAKQFAKK